jgi:hypothetical protein
MFALLGCECAWNKRKILVLNYDKLVSTSYYKFFEVASARFYCIYKAFELILNSDEPFLTHSYFAWHNISNGEGISRDIGVVLILAMLSFNVTHSSNFGSRLERLGMNTTSGAF